jgi:hypothetical protein
MALAMVVLTVAGCGKSTANEDEAQSPKTEIADNDLAAPEGIKATAADGAVTVKWSAVDGALKYDVYGAGIHAVTRDTYYTFGSLAPGEYTVAVRAFGGPRSSQASRVTFVVADGGAVETTAVDVPETKAESKNGSKKAESTTNTDKAKSTGGSGPAGTGNSSSNSGPGKNTDTGNGKGSSDSNKNNSNSNSNTGTGTGNNADTGNNGGGKGTGTGNNGSGGDTTTPNPPADPNAGKTWVPEKQVWHEATYKEVERQVQEVIGVEYWLECTKCEFKTLNSQEMATHMYEFGHGYRSVGHDIYGWVKKIDRVVDKEGWLETIPAHWE